MKSFTAVALLATGTMAFPAKVMEELSRRQINAAAPQGAGALPLVPPPFVASEQYVSTTGQYAFVAPGPTDARGMCPGLNALANHGYLPHNGVATIAQLINATTTGFGMGVDLATFLSVYGAVVDGTLTGWSISGLPHTGIAGSHGNYDGDSSPNYADLNQYGSNVKLVISQFKALYELQTDAATANYNLDVLAVHRKNRLQESKDKNPYFVYNPFAGLLVTQAAYTFIYRFMANKSAEYPEGVLDKSTLKSFFSITEDASGNLTWKKGYERFPNNFYRRNTLDQYTIPYFQTDILYLAETVPELLITGCNTGTVDSFDAITPEVISGGAYTAAQVASNPVCYASEYAIASLPSFTGLSASSLTTLLAPVTSALAPLNCTPITSPATNPFGVCPGLSAYGGPIGPIAPGAIQS